MSYVVHDLLIDPSGQLPPSVVIKVERSFGAESRDEAVEIAMRQLAALGITPTALTRAARTPSGGWSISFALA